MPGKAGKNLIMKVESPSGSNTFILVGGCRTNEMSKEADNIEVTNKGSNDWQEFIEDAGVRKVNFSASGICDDMDALDRIEAACDDRVNLLCQFIDDDGEGNPIATYQGSFKVPSFTRAGEYNGAQNWSASFVSNGEITKS